MHRFFIRCTFIVLLLSGCATLQSVQEYAGGEQLFNSGDQEYAEGERLFKSGQYAEAHSHALKAHNEEPDNPKYQSLLGWTYLKQGNLTEARRLFSDLYNGDHNSLPALMGLAWVEYSSGQSGQAEVWFQKELARAKENLDNPPHLTFYFPAERDFYISCLSDANYGLGLMALARKDYSGAQSYLSNALKYPNSFIGHGPIRAALEDSQGKKPQYAADFKQGKQKESAQAYFQMGDFKRAQEQLQAYLSHNGKDDEARIMDAWCDLYLGWLPVAFNKFNALSRSKTSNTQAVLGRGVTELYLGQLDQADADFQQVVAREPENVRARVARGAVAFKRGNLPEAIKIYTANLPYLPKKEPFFDWSSHALNNLGWSYIRTGQYQEALKTFELLKNHHTRPIYPEPYDGLGWTYVYMGKNDEAQQAFQQSLKLAPGDVVAKNGLAKIAAAQK